MCKREQNENAINNILGTWIHATGSCKAMGCKPRVKSQGPSSLWLLPSSLHLWLYPGPGFYSQKGKWVLCLDVVHLAETFPRIPLLCLENLLWVPPPQGEDCCSDWRHCLQKNKPHYSLSEAVSFRTAAAAGASLASCGNGTQFTQSEPNHS